MTMQSRIPQHVYDHLTSASDVGANAYCIIGNIEVDIDCESDGKTVCYLHNAGVTMKAKRLDDILPLMPELNYLSARWELKHWSESWGER